MFDPAVCTTGLSCAHRQDFDITGIWDTMIPDAEIISLVCSIVTKLEVGEFVIKLNHRKILDGIFEVCGVPADKIRTISSAVDKLDKVSRQSGHSARFPDGDYCSFLGKRSRRR